MDPITELKALRHELETFTKSANAGDTVSGEQAARIDTVLARSTELAEIVQRGQKNTAKLAPFADASYNEDNDGNRNRSSEAAGFITPASLKSVADNISSKGLKALLVGGATGTAVPLDKDPIRMGQPSLGLLSLIPVKRRDTPKYSHLRQTVRTNNAGKVVYPAVKPTSIYSAAEFSNELVPFAHLSEMLSKYLLEDNEELQRFVLSELQNGIVRAVTADAVATFSATSGINTLATSAGYSAAKGIDGIYAGASLISDQGFNPNLIILGRPTYDAFRLSKDAENRYLAGNPFDGGTMPGLWGITTLVSSDVAAGTALVMDTSKVGISTDKQGVSTEADTASGFDKNQVRFRTEGRFATDVFDPRGITRVTLTA